MTWLVRMNSRCAAPDAAQADPPLPESLCAPRARPFLRWKWATSSLSVLAAPRNARTRL